MISTELKSQIQTAYSRLLQEKGYRSRHCQRQMIADIANTLGSIEVDDDGVRVSDNPVCVIEAGTGTGKTVAYAIAALPIAKALGKRLVIATATVALQEQIVLLDLPDIRRHTGLEFSFALAKGRRRYLCLSRLDLALQAVRAKNHTLALYDDEILAADPSHQVLYAEMLARLGRGDWDGERDSWPVELANDAWFPVSTDHVQCTGRKCSHYENCFFYKAREKIHKVDCIVSNHDLVLADLMMGGGAVLPVPEDTIYIFDEGHHLPEKAINHFANFQLLRSTQAWLEQQPAALRQLASELGQVGGLPGNLSRIEDNIVDLVSQLQSVAELLEPLRELAEGDDREQRYRFAGGLADRRWWPAVNPFTRPCSACTARPARSRRLLMIGWPTAIPSMNNWSTGCPCWRPSMLGWPAAPACGRTTSLLMRRGSHPLPAGLRFVMRRCSSAPARCRSTIPSGTCSGRAVLALS